MNKQKTGYPTTLLEIKNIHNIGKKRFHPTQKPVELLEYLIKTYSNNGETILDNCMGSGSTGVACMNTGRKFIGIELDSNYFNINKLENIIDIKKFEQYILEFKPLVSEVANHFGISKCSVYNLIKRLDNPNLVLNSYNPRKAKSIEDIDEEELKRLYLEGWSILDLVKKYRIKKHRISKFLKDNGIKIHRGLKGYKSRI